MIRLKVGLLILGVVLVYLGGREWLLCSTAKSAADLVVLSELEGGERLSNTYVRLEKHVAHYPYSVYSYDLPKYAKEGEIGPSARLNYVYYPVMSEAHPFHTGWAKLVEQFGALDNVPEDVQGPVVDNVAMLVRTTRFQTLGEIPPTSRREAEVRGLVVNRITSLSDEEAGLLKDLMPGVDPHSLYILEEGRRPSSFSYWGGLMFGGLLSFLAGCIWIIKGRGRPAKQLEE